MASLASPTTYSEPAMQTTSFGPAVSMACLAAFATSDTANTSEIIFLAVAYSFCSGKARSVFARVMIAREHTGSKLLSMAP